MSTNFNKNMKGQCTEAGTDFKCLINSSNYTKLVLLWNKMNNDHLFLICCVLYFSYFKFTFSDAHSEGPYYAKCNVHYVFVSIISISLLISAFIAITTYG